VSIPVKRKSQFARLLLLQALLLTTLDVWCQNLPAAQPLQALPATQSAPQVIPPQNPSGLQPLPQTERERLVLMVGRSTVLRTSQRLRRVYVSNPDVIDSITASPHELILTAKAGGTSSVAVWTEDGATSLYTVVADLDLSEPAKALRMAFPYEHIGVESQGGRLLLTGAASSPAVIDAALKLLASYSKDVVSSVQVLVVHAPQVQLRVRIAEVDRTKLTQFGINILSGGTTTAVTQTQQFGGIQMRDDGGLGLSDLLNIFVYNKNIDLGAILKDLQQNQVLQVLAEPNITALSGQTAHFLSGGEFPFPVIQGSSGGLTSITIQFRPYGVRLDFTPIVNPDHTIRLKVAPEVSALDYTNAVTISGYTIPAISTRRAETEIELQDGQSFAMSGLLDRRTTEKLGKMPGIGDIPILGELFKSRDINKSLTELVVIITPVLVDPLTNPVAIPLLPKEAVPNLSADPFDNSLKSKNDQPKEQVTPPAAEH
jgi:pilus assembly protein CpaC